MMDASQGLEGENELSVCEEQQGNKCSAFSNCKQWSASGRWKDLEQGLTVKPQLGVWALAVRAKRQLENLHILHSVPVQMENRGPY